MTTLWDTTGQEVVHALLAERRAGGAVAAGLALSLVVVADERDVRSAEQAATLAAQAHPCRLLVVVRRQLEANDRLDAEVSVGGRFGAAEAVVLRTYGRLTLHTDSVVLPLLAPDAPVVTWWHSAPPEEIATDPLGVLADRRITDSARGAEPLAVLRRRAEDFAPGDTDLAWTRLTGWRAPSRTPRTSPRGTPTWPGPGSPAGGRCSPRRSTRRPTRPPRPPSPPSRETPAPACSAAGWRRNSGYR